MEAYRQIASELSPRHRLIIRGGGPLLHSVASRSWTGFARFTSSALVAVSPRYVGLSAIQSVSFGVPKRVARDEPHSPEVAALYASVNGEFFKVDSAASLTEGLLRFARDTESWTRRRPATARVYAEPYSVKVMADGLITAVASAQSRPSEHRSSSP